MEDVKRFAKEKLDLTPKNVINWSQRHRPRVILGKIAFVLQLLTVWIFVCGNNWKDRYIITKIWTFLWIIILMTFFELLRFSDLWLKKYGVIHYLGGETGSQSRSTSIDILTSDGIPKAIKDKGYKLGERLGSGAFSTVYKATNVNSPGVTLACKWFDLTDKKNEIWREKCLKSEMKIMMTLKHPNIIKVYEVIKTRKMAFIFMACAQNGSIGEYLEKTGQPIKERQTKKWFHDIASAVNYLHTKGIAHRDIKPDNFLLDNDSKDALLSDFGFSCMACDNQRLMKGTNCGTNLYKAPELLELGEGLVYDPKKVDMYALGVSLFEMLNLFKPFGESIDQNDNNSLTSYIRKQRNKKYRLNKNVRLSENAVKCLDLLLEPVPDRRITAQSLLKIKWFDSK